MDKRDEIEIDRADDDLAFPGDKERHGEVSSGRSKEIGEPVRKRRTKKSGAERRTLTSGSGSNQEDTESGEERPRRKRRSYDSESGKRTERAEGAESSTDRPRRKTRSGDMEGAESSTDRPRRKRHSGDMEGAENSTDRPRRKRRPGATEGAESSTDRPRRKSRSGGMEGAESSTNRPRRKRRPGATEGAESSTDRPRRKRRPGDMEGAESSTDRSRRKPRSGGMEGAESSTDRPRRKRRSGSIEGAESSTDRPRRKRRSGATEGAESSPERLSGKRRAEAAGDGKRRRRTGEPPKVRTEETRTRRRAKKRTYIDVLKDLVVDNSLMAWIIKALFCLLLFIIVLFVVRGIRNKSKDTGAAVTTETESLSDESGLTVTLTDLQKKTQDFLEDGAGAVDENSITILGVGDNLVHEQVFLSAKTTDGYDFRPFYTNVKKFISSADLATVNQETPLATALGEPSGYPHFNTPTEMGDALIDTGFDVANMGNNHMFDKGVDGAYVTREYWDEKNIPCTGFYYGYDDLFDFRVIEKNGIKVAFLSFVEMTNDELPSSSSAIVAYMNDRDLVKSMLEEAKQKADIVVVHAHWGDENTDMTTAYVYDEAQKLVDYGADIIFGNHSHVLQDLVTLTRESDGQKCPVIYSLGNFFSAQKVRDQLVSGILNVQVTKDTVTGKVKPTAMGFLPIVTHYTGDRENLMLYPLSMYSQELAEQHGTAGVSTDGMPLSMDYIETLYGNHIPAQYLGRMGPIQQD